MAATTLLGVCALLPQSARAVGVRYVVAGGGGTATGGGVGVLHTIGQPTVGRAASPDAGVRSGFWETLAGSVIVSTEETPPVPLRYALAQSAPNPTRATTTIRFTLAKPGDTSLRIYDAAGRQVAVLLDSFMTPGGYDVHFRVPDLASGVYFYVLKSGSFSKTRSLTLVR